MRVLFRVYMKSELITKEYYVQFRDLFIPATWTPDVV